MKHILIKDVIKGSIAEEMEIEPGDYLISVNDTEINDILDYKFQIFDADIVVLVEKTKLGEQWEIEIEKEENEDLGIVFEEQLIDKPKNCANKCIFCFMDQLPPDVRETLLFKDDDFRLSFMTGNYVTLTNSGFKDLDRIIKYHLSPINISVHATDGEVRKMMLNNKNADKILDYIKYLTDAGISINAQIVLCKGINDGKILDKTIEDLAKFFPELLCIAIVPVGLTKYRENLYHLESFEKEDCKMVINQVEKWQNKFKKEIDSNVVYLSDEFYLTAEMPMPNYEHYEDFPSLEDGIGMMAYFDYEFNQYLETLESRKINKTISMVTGKLAYKFIREKLDILEKKYDGLKVNLYQIENNFFGNKITVAGLITGVDIYEQIHDKELGEYLIVSSNMIKDDKDVFLDNMEVSTLQEKLNTKIVISKSDGRNFIDSVIL